MKTRTVRLLVTWNVVLTVLLLIALAFVAAGVQAASDPPVKIYSTSLDHGVAADGAGTTADKSITSTSYQVILSKTVDFTGQSHLHQCMVLGSANVINPASGGTGYRYDFTMQIDSGITNWSKMTLELSDNGGIDDPNYWPVTTNRVWTNVSSAPHTFSFVARKQAVGYPDLTVDNAHMTVICIKKLLPSDSASDAAPVEEVISDNLEQAIPNDR
ncbi:MAG: hypothetical protein IT331_19105 [Anaerolineae bacterium]|nr:hypothetical protein [Anaerolineae bacterium]